MARSLFSAAALLALVAMLFSATSVQATMAQGNLNFERDHIIQYSTSKFADTEAFCRSFRSACVDYVGPIGTYGSHHQLDCVFELADGTKPQPGPKIHAFCGGLAKNPDGTWTNGGEITDYTKAMVSQKFSGSAAIKGAPLSHDACVKFAAKHKNVVCQA
ncbi:hypothetical protein JCM10213_005051 [Rhodosporidiobolus nylandii]